MFGVTAADNPDNAVRWSATVQAAAAITHDSTIMIDLYGAVGDGSHVYGAEQHSGGPTPLRIAVETNDIATAAGPLTGAVAQKVHDPHFGSIHSFLRTPSRCIFRCV
jgi:hypothetical protein